MELCVEILRDKIKFNIYQEQHRLRRPPLDTHHLGNNVPWSWAPCLASLKIYEKRWK